MEDEEINVPYSTSSIKDYLGMIDTMSTDILKEYKNIEECKDLLTNLNNSYKKKFLTDLIIPTKDKEFNLFLKIAEYSNYLASEFLYSDIPLESTRKK